MNIHEEDYPYSIYKRPEGDNLLDAHNDIIAVFDPHTELEIERLIAAAPEMKGLLAEAIRAMLEIGKYSSYEERSNLSLRIAGILCRIEGDEKAE